MIRYLLHSVEKYTKTLSRWKIFRETTQQNYVNSYVSNVCFSAIWGISGLFLLNWFWRLGFILEFTVKLFSEIVKILWVISYQKLVNFKGKILLWSAMVCRSFNVKLQFRPSSTNISCETLRKFAQKCTIFNTQKWFY